MKRLQMVVVNASLNTLNWVKHNTNLSTSDKGFSFKGNPFLNEEVHLKEGSTFMVNLLNLEWDHVDTFPTYIEREEERRAKGKEIVEWRNPKTGVIVDPYKLIDL